MSTHPDSPPDAADDHSERSVEDASDKPAPAPAGGVEDPLVPLLPVARSRTRPATSASTNEQAAPTESDERFQRIVERYRRRDEVRSKCARLGLGAELQELELSLAASYVKAKFRTWRRLEVQSEGEPAAKDPDVERRACQAKIDAMIANRELKQLQRARLSAREPGAHRPPVQRLQAHGARHRRASRSAGVRAHGSRRGTATSASSSRGDPDPEPEPPRSRGPEGHPERASRRRRP